MKDTKITAVKDYVKALPAELKKGFQELRYGKNILRAP